MERFRLEFIFIFFISVIIWGCQKNATQNQPINNNDNYFVVKDASGYSDTIYGSSNGGSGGGDNANVWVYQCSTGVNNKVLFSALTGSYEYSFQTSIPSPSCSNITTGVTYTNGYFSRCNYPTGNNCLRLNRIETIFTKFEYPGKIEGTYKAFQNNTVLYSGYFTFGN
jgi:hypothetical protein